ncbi:hypothetical protein PIB30_043381 [Stylosanthes scabra]|uniref:Uncharacterized protein n=1 Tax=Stylosanthes scabra TaxID=79078 RepID=A0ABU6ZE94_9FABA|nr:hypothetical protein [Stylosanthes scabra]
MYANPTTVGNATSDKGCNIISNAGVTKVNDKGESKGGHDTDVDENNMDVDGEELNYMVYVTKKTQMGTTCDTVVIDTPPMDKKDLFLKDELD